MLTEPGFGGYRERRVASAQDPLQVAARLASRSGLSPYLVYERAGEYCFAAGVLAQLRLSPGRTLMTVGARTHTLPAALGPIEAIGHFAAHIPASGWRMYGWAAFELAYLLAGLAPADPDADLLHLFVPRAEVRLGGGGAVLRAVDGATLTELSALVAAPHPPPCDPPRRVRILVQDTGNYRAAVTEALARIRAGDLEKVILSRTVPVPEPVDLVATYMAGRRANTPARSFLFSLGRMRAAGFSPETVVQVSPAGRVQAQPLAGTRARHACPARDRQLREQLLTDPKEIYEHAVSVRAVWQELADLAGCSDVRIEQYMAVRQRGTVQHLASTLSGQLLDAAPARPWSAFAALFPSVTATGIPKPAAYQAIRDLEPCARGLYAGAVLACGQDGALDAALVLRTVLQDDHGTWLQAGAGIVRQSQPEREHEETCEKLRSVADHVIRLRPPAIRGLATS